jgi:hypothetical protein
MIDEARMERGDSWRKASGFGYDLREEIVGERKELDQIRREGENKKKGKGGEIVMRN